MVQQVCKCSVRVIQLGQKNVIRQFISYLIKNILYGRSTDPKILTIKKICDGLDITLAEFFSTPAFDALEQAMTPEFKAAVKDLYPEPKNDGALGVVYRPKLLVPLLMNAAGVKKP